MIGINRQLKELEAENKPIRVGLVGAGLMGKGMVSQMTLMKGMKPSLIASNKVSDAVEAYILAGIPREDIVISSKLSQINQAMERGKFIATDNSDLVTRANLVDVVVDATGVPDAGAKIALDSINNGKHIVMLNIEADATVGSILNKKAQDAGLVYTGTAGDEPGVLKEIYDFADAIGFEIIALGKGKNNPIDFSATPDTVRQTALKKGLKPLRLASFVDGTNTMIEMAAISNATGLVADIRGCHGPKAQVNDLPGIFSLKEDGGILNRTGIVDYVNGIAPGVFAVVRAELPQIQREMKLVSMGDGPNYVLYRPYHLVSLETPISIARAALYQEATIAPLGKPVSEVITVAKKDLKAGQNLDGIGEYTILGTLESYEKTREGNYLPIGLVTPNTRVKRDIKKGEIISYDMVDLDETTMVYKLRQEQEKTFK